MFSRNAFIDGRQFATQWESLNSNLLLCNVTISRIHDEATTRWEEYASDFMEGFQDGISSRNASR